jgi:hypothetical protein
MGGGRGKSTYFFFRASTLGRVRSSPLCWQEYRGPRRSNEQEEGEAEGAVCKPLSRRWRFRAAEADVAHAGVRGRSATGTGTITRSSLGCKEEPPWSRVRLSRWDVGIPARLRALDVARRFICQLNVHIRPIVVAHPVPDISARIAKSIHWAERFDGAIPTNPSSAVFL